MVMELNSDVDELDQISLENIVPQPGALALLTPEEAGELRALPLHWAKGELVVASSRATDATLIPTLQKCTGWQIKLLACTDFELEVALTSYYAVSDAQAEGKGLPISSKINPLALLQALNIVEAVKLRQELIQAVFNNQDWLDRLQAQELLDQNSVVALKAAQYNYPHLRTLRFQPDHWLSLIIRAEVATKWQVVPFKADGERLWVFTPTDKPILNPAPLAQILGLQVRVVVLARAEWKRAFDYLYKEAASEVQPPISTDEVLLKKWKWSNKAHKKQALSLARSTNTSLTNVVQEQGWLSEDDWREIESVSWNLQPTRPGRQLFDNEGLHELHLSSQLLSRWQLTPLFIDKHKLHIGLAEPAQARFLVLLEMLIKRPVVGHWLTQARFNRAVNNYRFSTQPVTAPLPTLAEWLLAGNYLTEPKLGEAVTHSQTHSLRLDESLLQLKLISPTDLAEVWSLQHSLPWFPLESLPRGLEPARCQELNLSPTLATLLEIDGSGEQTPSILVAVANPYVQLNSTEPKSAVVLQPLLVPVSTMATMTRLAEAEHLQESELLRYLVQQGHLRVEEVPQLLEGLAATMEPLDRLLQASLKRDISIYPILADFAQLPYISLAPKYNQETFLDEQGRLTRRTSVNDPVSQATTQIMTLTELKELGVIFFAQNKLTVQVAIANPLDSQTRAKVEARVAPLGVKWYVAPREEMEAAHSRAAGRKNIGTYLLEAGLITPDQLENALEEARRANIRLGQTLVQLQYVSQPELVNFLAKQHDLAYFDLNYEMLDLEVVQLISAEDARSWGALPVAIDDQSATVAFTDPLNSEAVRQVSLALNRPVTPVFTTEQAFEEILEKIYQEEYANRSIKGLLLRTPEESAFRVITKSQKIILIVLSVLAVIAVILQPLAFFIFCNVLTTVFYVALSCHRFYLLYKALSGSLEVPVSDEEVSALDDRTLPIFTIMIPMYKEAEVLPKLMGAISSLDYPFAKLDVKLLMEENDPETVNAARALNLPPNFQHIILPDSKPKTKPKACNYGLIKARGEYVVIFDAEDLPDPDQLKKVVVAFEKAGPKVACIQAKLNFFNRTQNILTRWFTIEYSMWFDLMLPGLVAANAPLPLGGTSNHFRRNLLEELGGWDPFNVTEDADLGVRLYKAGYKTAVIDSTTYEEANSDFKNWIRQRSRWIKGYIQTWLVHSRHPLKLRREIGTTAFIGFNLTVAGTFACLLINPIYWLLTFTWFLTHWGVIQQIFPPVIYYLGGINLFLGNFVFVYVNLAGCMRRQFYGLVKYALLIPLYWIMMSISAWKGFIQLMYKPFYWEKTVHGLNKNTPGKKH